MADRRQSVAESVQTGNSSDAPHSQPSPAVPNAGHASFRRYVPGFDCKPRGEPQPGRDEKEEEEG